MPGLRLTPGFVADFSRLDAFEVRHCRPVNAIARAIPVCSFFRFVSRIGDWPLWVALLLTLPVVYGHAAWAPVAHMAATAVVGILIYKALKRSLLRERPFASHSEVHLFGKPMDRYSFPSGHTLHACCFMAMLATFFPLAMWLMLPLAVSIALSRGVLGLHYPSDVLAGAMIGFALAKSSLLFAAAPV